MKFVGLHTQIARNNRKSFFLLLAFPMLVLAGVYLTLFFLYRQDGEFHVEATNADFLHFAPIVMLVVALWFTVAFFFHTQMINGATHARPLQRKEDPRIYNLTENLCMSVGMKTPKLYVIETPQLNAFASGINEKTYAVTLTRGIINHLSDAELEGVIAHELTHIRNRDVRLLIVTIVFVGIFGLIVDVVFRTFLLNSLSSRRRNDRDGGSNAAMLIILIIAVVLYLLSVIFKFALSRSREYLADAGAVEMTKNAPALANALRKISGNSQFHTSNDEVRELFIDNTPEKSNQFFSTVSNIFATHPPIKKRIQVLENL